MKFDDSNLAVIKATFNVVYPRKQRIQNKLNKKINDIIDMLEDFYLPPQFLDIPENIEPEIPRAIFNAVNGHSQITLAQTNANLNANFDKKFQNNFALCKEYMEQRSDQVLSLLKMAEISRVHYLGMSTIIQFKQENDDVEILNHVMSTLNQSVSHTSPVIDVNNRFSFVLQDEFFANVTIGNYRNYNLGTSSSDTPSTISLADAEILDKGVFVHLDVNNRYHFNVTGNDTDDMLRTKNFLTAFTDDFVRSKVFKILREGVFDL